MTRPVLVATHGGVSTELVHVVRELMGDLPALESLSVSASDSLDSISSRMAKWAARIPPGARGIVLTDLRNSSATVAAIALSKKYPIDCACGVNLPLLLKAVSPSESTPADIVAVGQSGIDLVLPAPGRQRNSPK